MVSDEQSNSGFRRAKTWSSTVVETPPKMESSGETPLFLCLYVFTAAVGTEFLFHSPGAVPIPILPCEGYRHPNNASFCLFLCYSCHSYLPVAMQELIAVPCPCPCVVSQLFWALFFLSCGRQYNPAGFYVLCAD